MKFQRGFTVTEMAIALAVLGVLASIGVPNFISWVNRSKQNEAKTNLEALYSAEKSFYFNRLMYNPRLDAIGFKPSGELYYRVGFAADSAGSSVGTAACINTSSVSCPSISWTETPSATGAGAISATEFVGNPVPNTFRAEARGRINGAAADVWQIDDTNAIPTNTNTNL